MAQIDPIWKYCQLLDRLTRNDKRIIDCITALARDYQHLAPVFTERLESKLYLSIEPLRKLLYLYVVDSLSFNISIMRDYLSLKVSQMFAHSHRMANRETKIDMEKLLIVWESQGRFPSDVLEDMREKMAPTPPIISSPIHSHQTQGLFDLSDLTDWLNQNSYAPQSLLQQASDEAETGLFTKLLENQRSKAEYEKLSVKLTVVEHNKLHFLLLFELYDELPRQCLMCGLRFSLDSELDTHLDLHFSMMTKKVSLKSWLPGSDLWVDPKLHRGLLPDDQPQETIESACAWAVCNPDQLFCQLCGEPFEIIPKDSSWLCKDAARVFVEDQNKEVILHIPCVKSINLPQSSLPASESLTYSDSFV
jgi:hypothetical protein